MLAIWKARVAHESYYEILEIPMSASPADIKEAFHGFALKFHPDQYVEEDPKLGLTAAEIFKRGVEAYRTLSRPGLRTKYDANLAKGKLRYVQGEIEEKKAAPRRKALFEIARTPRAKQFAVKADRFIAAGKLEDARIALVTALGDDFDNLELQGRLEALQQAIARGRR